MYSLFQALGPNCCLCNVVATACSGQQGCLSVISGSCQLLMVLLNSGGPRLMYQLLVHGANLFCTKFPSLL